MNIIIFIGPPASGKGTQSKKLAEDKGFTHVSTGALLRANRDKAPNLSALMDSGEILPDSFILDILYKHLEKNNLLDNLILDGAPRTVDQYNNMKEWFAKKGKAIDHAIYIKISKEEAIRRLSSRREDKTTGVTYSLIFDPPPSDVDPKNLVQREDDKPEAISVRFDAYHKATEPIIAELKKDGILHEINGERGIDEIYEDVKKIFE